ncbi:MULTISPECIES: pyridoxal kinase [Francisella]|uniref:pyridoxal kinase n=1 Tax=Francisella opportunistica TaxID=2016517 RepID=A0A345JPK3_9GAMM|nr:MULTISPECIES: pyridoxal kinase [Francisella]APC90922.1 Pyridoxal kinase [Francisella sp. MA067296]AXH29249.1 pyridoxal kinase [Francisella opportunistica]AXH30900.1 pyridoxal kinase [Francisella opportunistica]AXH32546.1 pyridoxal kinase [Francisella opportunistica]
MSFKIPKVLSIQSHVAYGYAGNKAAVFTMQKLGIEVSPIYTVQLSNHTQYDFFKGSFFSAEDIQNVIDGMIVNGFLAQQDAILSGYIGNLEIAKVIANTVAELKKVNNHSLYCCDPVFGDKYDENETGHIFASADHPNIFLEHLLPLADIITPNLFELSVLSNFQIRDYDDIVIACKKLINKTGNHNQVIIITSVSFSKDKTGIGIYQKGYFSYLESPKYKVQSKVSGSGDITAAMFLSYLLKGKNLNETLKAVIQCLDGIFRVTHDLNTDELALIQAQEYIR